MDEMTLTLNSPITEEQWDMIEDVDFDHTDSITFYTKHGKEVEFMKRKAGKWITNSTIINCSVCKHCSWSKNAFEDIVRSFNYCPNCGARMEGVDNEQVN